MIPARRQVVLLVEIANGLKMKQNVMSGNLIKRAPLLRKPRFANANNAHPVHRNPQGTTVVEQVMTTRVSDMVRGTATLEKAEEVLRKQYASSQMSDVQVALSGMHLAGNELPSEMLRKTLQKAHLSVSTMNKGLDMLFKVLFLQTLLPEARLKISGYSGATQQLMNEAADSYVITLRQEKQHKLPVSLASNKQDPAVSEHGNPDEVGALSALQALLSEEESSINRKLRSATNSRQAHSDNEEHGSRAEHCGGNERSRHQRWGHRQNDRATATIQ